MKRSSRLLVAVMITVSLYVGAKALAYGIPADKPMTYAGTLTENGAPVTAQRNISINLWNDLTSTDDTKKVCATVPAAKTQTTVGRFEVSLGNTCTAAVKAHPDLWVEVVVDGTALPRTKLGAVPFAVEAAHAANGVLTGTVVAFAGTSAPPGWLPCDGAPVTRAAYPALFGVLGVAHGSGDGTTTFNVPDYRGRFLRGVDGTAGRDPDAASRTAATLGGAVGNTVGSVQDEEFKSHIHQASRNDFLMACTNPPTSIVANGQGGCKDAPPTAAAGGSETRPKNAYVNWIIRY